MNLISICGLIGGTFTTISFLPQLIQVWKTRSTKDISAGMFILFTIGVMFWLVYGILIKEWPVIIANGITLIFACVILGFKAIYK
jgi:MtN3 and saliva related transmembrane protein